MFYNMTCIIQNIFVIKEATESLLNSSQPESEQTVPLRQIKYPDKNRG